MTIRLLRNADRPQVFLRVFPRLLYNTITMAGLFYILTVLNISGRGLLHSSIKIDINIS
jgi:hypothetical protein